MSNFDGGIRQKTQGPTHVEVQQLKLCSWRTAGVVPSFVDEGRSFVVGNLLSKIVIALMMHHITSHYNSCSSDHVLPRFPSSPRTHWNASLFRKFCHFCPPPKKKKLLGIPPCHIGIIGKGIQIITHHLDSLPNLSRESTWKFSSQDLFQWLGSTPIYKPWTSAIWKGSHNPILRGLTITMVINHLQVLGWPSK